MKNLSISFDERPPAVTRSDDNAEPAQSQPIAEQMQTEGVRSREPIMKQVQIATTRTRPRASIVTMRSLPPQPAGVTAAQAQTAGTAGTAAVQTQTMPPLLLPVGKRQRQTALVEAKPLAASPVVVTVHEQSIEQAVPETPVIAAELQNIPVTPVVGVDEMRVDAVVASDAVVDEMRVDTVVASDAVVDAVVVSDAVVDVDAVSDAVVDVAVASDAVVDVAVAVVVTPELSAVMDEESPAAVEVEATPPAAVESVEAPPVIAEVEATPPAPKRTRTDKHRPKSHARNASASDTDDKRPAHARGKTKKSAQPPAEKTTKPTARKAGKPAEKTGTARYLLIAVRDAVIAFVLLTILIQFISPTVVREHSMEDTLVGSEILLVANKAYWFGSPEYGDIVLFHTALTTEAGSEKTLVKRLIGLPGDRIAINGGVVFRNGKPLDEPYLKEGVTMGAMSEVVVPADSYFVMGDNRAVSRDSRDPSVGFVAKDQLRGKVILRIFPLNRFGTL